jgi:hypothetical protein
MKHKVLGVVFVLAIALGVISVKVRTPLATPPAGPAGTTKVPKISLERPLACFRVYEDAVTQDHIDYRGAIYKGVVSGEGFKIGAVRSAGSIWNSREFTVEFGGPRLEQGSFALECTKGTFRRAGFGQGQIDRGSVIEEYVFENNRVEQLYRFPQPLASGPLRLSIPVQSDLEGPVVAHEPNEEGFKDFRFKHGGLAFCDVRGDTRLSYTGAVALDGAGHRMPLTPRFENGRIQLDVPAQFMDSATYPVVIDPWLDFQGSGSGQGVSLNPTGSHAETPALDITDNGQPFIAWSDDSAATSALPNNTDIYLKWWNGFEFFGLGSSISPGGLSATPGKSSNPSLSMGVAGSPIVAWEDDSNGPIAILVKKWPLTGEPNVGTWADLAGSGSGQGISFQFSPAQHPSVTGVFTVIPGVITTDPNTGITTSTPSTTIYSPVVVYDLPFGGATQIVCQLYYPGAPAQPVSAVNPQGLPSVPEGWYSLGPANGKGVEAKQLFSISGTPSGGVSEFPSISLDSATTFSVAWQDTRNGNYEIYFVQYQAAAANAIEIRPDPVNTLTQVNTIPPGNFVQVGGSATAGGVSNTLTPSQFPSLATDFQGGTLNHTIAWQETEAAAPPNPGTTSQIYVARSVNGAAFAGVAGSATTGGVSHTLNQATSPSLDVNGQYMGVAWADDSNSRSSIYVRRFFLGVGGSGTWDQVGFQGSAFPALNAETFAPIGGISQSVNFSIQPRIKLDQFGDPIVAWADGSSATFDILLKVFSPNAPGIASGIGTNAAVFTTTLRQTLTDPSVAAATDITTGGFSSGTTVFLSSRVFTETLLPAGTSLRLEVEVQPTGSPFTNTANFQTLFVAPDDPVAAPANLAVLKFDGLPNANYYWQARTVDQIGRSSPWIQFPVLGGVSFRINTAAPPGGGPGSNGPANTAAISVTTRNRGHCGLLGLDAVVLLGLLRVIRRKRKS